MDKGNIDLDPEKSLKKIKRCAEIVKPEEDLLQKFCESQKNNKPLRVKLGFDPTAPDLHLGHVVVLKQVKVFQDLGHLPVIVIGDFTARIGDPTGRNKTRPPLSREDIDANAKTYLSQLSKVIDLSRAEVVFNSSWFDRLNFSDVIDLVSKVTVSQIMQRDDFSNRFKVGIPIHIHELLYPIVQAYDSFAVSSDVEIGGTDQLFNCLVGRDIQKLFGKRPQVVVCSPILRGLDGQKKMGKSLGNYVGLTDNPIDMYGKIMSIPDDLILEYARLVGSFSDHDLRHMEKQLTSGSKNPMEVKKELAFDFVKQFHDKIAAENSAQHFYRQVQSRDPNLIEFTQVKAKDLGLNLTDVSLVEVCAAVSSNRSKGELRRLIQGGGVSINSKKIKDPFFSVKEFSKGNFKLKIGKRSFFEVVNE